MPAASTALALSQHAHSRLAAARLNECWCLTRSRACTSAPAASRCCTALRWPLCAARLRGARGTVLRWPRVDLFPVAALGKAAESSKQCSVVSSRIPPRSSHMSGVSCITLRWSREAPSASRYLTTGRWPVFVCLSANRRFVSALLLQQLGQLIQGGGGQTAGSSALQSCAFERAHRCRLLGRAAGRRRGQRCPGCSPGGEFNEGVRSKKATVSV